MIHVIGIGVKGRESLGQDALSLVGKAALIIGGKRHLEEFPDAKAEKVPVQGGLERIAARIEKLKKDEDAVVLATGDPLLYGIASFIIKRFGKRRVNIIPNVSTVQEAFARVKEDSNGVKVLSAHGRGGLEALVDEILRNDKTALFTDGVNTPATIAKALIGKGARGLRAFVVESIGAKDERVIEGGLPDIASVKKFADLNVMILIGSQSVQKSYGPGISDNEFAHEGAMITKEEIRVISLSKLRVKKGSVVWDIGACTGSVAIEAALSGAGIVYAVEKDPKRVKDIVANRKRFGADNVEVIQGRAPESLSIIKERPGSVFVGGGGRDIMRILSHVSKRLLPGGRCVVNAVTMETASVATAFFKSKKWDAELIQVSIAKSRDLSGLTMLSAMNPVFIITGKKT
ncbi:MAG: precorrin-6y C5,15-methyltransferase (decarboxylating) subunit CbiE [Deltaproteobacteria bacterium]|nr:precorrin-6y C5,15-methyltransferase (decarboxylating) subunit CbiE [Deltaproteobacteria bacterium]